MLSVINVRCHEIGLYAEYYYVECRYADSCYAKCHGALVS
jgi:hypothetical protein